MAAQVISLAQRLRAPASRDWSRQELAEFYRVESALLQAGLELETERGLSDEGDPWFVFCRADTGEVFIHFARADGWYVVDGAAMGSPSRGRDFGALVADLISRHPLASVRRPGSNVLMHPAALLIALVGAAFFHSGRAKAAETPSHDGAPAADAKDGRRGLTLAGGAAPAAAVGDAARIVALDAAEVAAVLTGVAIGLRGLAESASSGSPASLESGPLAAPSPFAVPVPRDLASRGERGASAEMLGALSASDARTALTVMAVVHDLARSAAAAEATAAGMTPAAVVTADMSVREQGATPAAAPPPPSKMEPGALLLVRLVAGPLPQIEALAVVAADGALARLPPDRVVHVDQLPTFLADLVAHGEIIAAPDTAVPAKLADAPAAPLDHISAQVAPADDAQAHTGSTKAPAADGHPVEAAPQPAASTAPLPAAEAVAAGVTAGAAAPLAVTPASVTLPSTTALLVTVPVVAPPAPADHAVPPHSALLDAAVLAFVNAVANVQVLVSGHEVVFYDPRILSMLPAGETLDSITWRLDDGSSISLVGTASELHNFHGLG